MHTQIPAVKSQKQKSPASRVAGFVPFKLKSPRRGSRRGSPVRDRTGSPLNPVPTRCFRHRPSASRPRGPPAQRARGRPSSPPLHRFSEPGGAVRPPRQRDPRVPGQWAPRPGRACLAPSRPRSFVHRSSPAARKVPAARARPLPRPEAAAPDRPGKERRGGRGSPGPRRGRRPPPCLPAPPRSWVPADNARRRRGRSGRPGRPRRPPRNKRGQEPRKPGALMQ